MFMFFICDFMALKASDILYCFSQIFVTCFFSVEGKGTHIKYMKLSEILCLPNLLVSWFQ